MENAKLFWESGAENYKGIVWPRVAVPPPWRGRGSRVAPLPSHGFCVARPRRGARTVIFFAPFRLYGDPCRDRTWQCEMTARPPRSRLVRGRRAERLMPADLSRERQSYFHAPDVCLA